MTADNDDATLNGVESLDEFMETNRNSLPAIKDRLPATLGADPRRAVICAIRNPDATVDEITEATSTDAPDLYAGLLDLAQAREPDTDDLADAQRAVLDLAIDGEFDPDARRSDWDTIARAAGRRAGTLTSKNPVRSFVDHERFDERLDRRLVERSLAGRASESDMRHMLDELGIRRLLVAVGEEPPEENLDDMQDKTQNDEPDDLTYLTERHTDADLEPGVEYHATVNNVVAYGVFVTVGGPTHDDISGLVHQSNMPPFISPRDFEVGDQVSVYLTERRANGDLSFALASIIDSARFSTQTFAPNTEFVDRREDEADEAEAPAPTGELEVDDDRPATATRTGEWSGGDKADAAVRNHGTWEDGELYCRHCGGGPFDGGFGLAGHLGWCEEHGDAPSDPVAADGDAPGKPRPRTGNHEALTLLDAADAHDLDSGVMSNDIRREVTVLDGNSVSSAMNALIEYGRAERGTLPGDGQYRYWLTDAGREYLADAGQFWGEGEPRTVKRIETDHTPTGDSHADKFGTGAHEVLTVTSHVAPVGGRYVPAAAVGQLVETIKPQSASPALSRMEDDGIVETETRPAPSGGVRKVYRLADAGAAVLDRLGPHPAHEAEPAPSSAPAPEPDEPSDEPSDEEVEAVESYQGEPEPDIDPSTAEVSVRETVTEPEPETPDPGDALADLRDDIMFRAAIAVGQHDLDADEVADALREVAKFVEERR